MVGVKPALGPGGPGFVGRELHAQVSSPAPKRSLRPEREAVVSCVAAVGSGRLTRTRVCTQGAGEVRGLRACARAAARAASGHTSSTQNHRITERSGLEGTSVGHPVQPSCPSRVTQSRLHRTTLSRRVWNISREGDSTRDVAALFPELWTRAAVSPSLVGAGGPEPKGAVAVCRPTPGTVLFSLWSSAPPRFRVLCLAAEPRWVPRAEQGPRGVPPSPARSLLGASSPAGAAPCPPTAAAACPRAGERRSPGSRSPCRLPVK